jgi:hypothetical protein
MTIMLKVVQQLRPAKLRPANLCRRRGMPECQVPGGPQADVDRPSDTKRPPRRPQEKQRQEEGCVPTLVEPLKRMM